MLGTSHAILENIATYILDQDGHRELRPTVTVLMSRAVQAHLSGERQAHVDDSQSQSQSQSATARLDPRQQLLAEIAELIHTASLLHRDVMDRDDDGASGRRRNSGAINYNIGNKLAVLAGDFLLSRASVELAKIRDLRVTELVSAVIGDIAEGGVLRDSPSDHLLLRSAAGDHHENDNTGHSETVVKAFFSRAYLADGSLIANTCRSSALLAADFMTLDDPAQVAQLETAAFQFGVHAAVAKQLNTEATLLDALVAHITSLKGSHAEDAGRDASAGDMADMDVFAFTGEHGVPLVSLAAAVAEGDASEWNQAAEANDCARVVDLIASNDCAAKLRGHALSHAAHAMSALQHLDPSEPREALMRLAYELATSPPRAQED